MSRKFSYSLTVLLVVVSCFITYLVNEYLHNQISIITNSTIQSIDNSANVLDCDFKIERLKGYKLIKPLVLVEPRCESPELGGLKTRIQQYIDGLKKTNKLISASVYLRYYGHGKWMSINPNEQYIPGSMIKVANMLTFLRMTELYPGLLDRKVRFEPPPKPIPAQTFNSKQIETGQVYTIRQLLKYMIAYSDNNATYLLNKNGDINTYHKLFNDLQIPLPASPTNNFLMTAKDFSVLFKVLYNSSYLSFENSELAIDLLSQCDFKQGIVKDLPPGLTVAHKFGEMADSESKQLHETALIYLDNTPYLISIMTKGYNINDLAPVLSSISKMVYDEVVKIREN